VQSWPGEGGEGGGRGQGGEKYSHKMDYTMCDPKGYGEFLAVLVINRVSILVTLVSKRVWFLHSCLGSFFFIIIYKTINKRPSQCFDICLN